MQEQALVVDDVREGARRVREHRFVYRSHARHRPTEGRLVLVLLHRAEDGGQLRVAQDQRVVGRLLELEAQRVQPVHLRLTRPH